MTSFSSEPSVAVLPYPESDVTTVDRPSSALGISAPSIEPGFDMDYQADSFDSGWYVPAVQSDPIPARIMPAGNLSLGYRVAKRSLDVVGALVLLALLAPVMSVSFLVLLVTTRGKPFFWQHRAGYCGRPFRMFKFRTMDADASNRQQEVENELDGPVFKNRCDPRITRIGRFLRKTSLDETPQLLSVLLGQMSLVGPRPLPLDEVARFEPWQRRRLAVMPGLTCLWQVSGRSDIGFDRWVQLDLWYVRHQSILTDLRLLLRTPMTVITGRGAY